jgi:replicative DNA helicase
MMSIKTADSMSRVASEIARESHRPRPVAMLLADLDRSLRDGGVASRHPLATGFHALDQVLAGGLKPGELTLIGGGQGIGKTTMTLQMARNLAAAGARVLYVCYEHEEQYLLNRLLAMESRGPVAAEFDEGVRLRDVVNHIDRAGLRENASLRALVEEVPALAGAAERMASYADRLLLYRGSATYTDLTMLAAELVSLRDAYSSAPCVLFVDYLQKVPVYPAVLSETDRVTRVVEGLKDLALSLGLPVVAIVAADSEGLRASRLRIHHLRGGSAILYEADLILILNEKHRIVTRQNLTYNPHLAQSFHSWIVCSIEKNRGGRQLVDLEFRKRFEYACFEPDGQPVAEVLIDERVQAE